MGKAERITRFFLVSGFIGAFISQALHLLIFLFNNADNSLNFGEGVFSQTLLTFSSFCFFVGLFALIQKVYQNTLWQDKLKVESVKL